MAAPCEMKGGQSMCPGALRLEQEAGVVVAVPHSGQGAGQPWGPASALRDGL